ncbi:FapA family protein [Desulfosporosinus fructosivorans]
MPEEIVRGHSLEEIREEWALKLNFSPEDITLEVIDKPGFFSRQWKVRLIWADQILQAPLLTSSQAIWDGTKYMITPGEGCKLLLPFMKAGEVWMNGKLQDRPFRICPGDQVEYHPCVYEGTLTWDMQVRFHGLSAVAKVRHELPGRYILPKDLPALEEINLAQVATWESLPATGEVWDETRLNADLNQLKVVHGRRPEAWSEIMAVRGVGEVVIAATTPVIPSVNAKLEDFVGMTPLSETGEKNIDFFASKVQLVNEGTILARKIPGMLGIQGQDVLGKVFPVMAVKDFQFRLKKNVYLSEDGLEVVAACAGQPVRIDERTYSVENVFVHNQDVDLATGSIEFPGDVLIQGSVQDGLRIIAGGRLEIKGSVSHAEIKAEKGARIYQNLLGGKIVVGEKFVVRSELLSSMSELRDQLSVCLQSTTELIKAPGASSFKPGQCLKLVMERQFSELPKLSNRVEKFVLDHKNDEIVTEDLIVTVQTAKRFLVGLGPLEPQSFSSLQRVEESLNQFIENITLEIPEKLSFVVTYVQGATVECAGSFECQKGVYNSDIRVEGDVSIEGVCRGGRITAGGNVKIRELGGSGVSSTFVQISAKSRLYVNYCHPNAIICVGKEIVNIEEACRNLEIYREDGRVQVEKIRGTPI